ncbi:5' nucleotidase, NT5C type [Corynebacterium aquilae]|uniref:Nucleotidase n=1 Tax=Corynebacterium aquilae DSM 44791 TaxID=1431546 RepID=A0A1L7CGP1_9CORY|nr:hypothetical protein [Corynebacterium aquilae]APT85031.1 hypothetical protein CAQU_08040 [Corynebacterium aquilae DSM 44791]
MKTRPARPVLGVDLDGVCMDYSQAFRPFAARWLRVPEQNLGDQQTYDIATAWGFKDHWDYLACHTDAVSKHMFATGPVIPGAAEAMQKISDAGVHIRIVTHRLLVAGHHQIAISDTAKWLDDNGFPYRSLCFTGLKDSVDADLYIEDAPTNIAALKKQGIESIIVDQPYNRDVAGLRIIDWAEDYPVVLRRLEELVDGFRAH